MTEKLKDVVVKSTKIIKNYVMMLVGLYIGFMVMVTFLNMDRTGTAMLLSTGLAVPIFVLLAYAILIIYRAKKTI